MEAKKLITAKKVFESIKDHTSLNQRGNQSVELPILMGTLFLLETEQTQEQFEMKAKEQEAWEKGIKDKEELQKERSRVEELHRQGMFELFHDLRILAETEPTLYKKRKREESDKVSQEFLVLAWRAHFKSLLHVAKVMNLCLDEFKPLIEKHDISMKTSRDF